MFRRKSSGWRSAAKDFIYWPSARTGTLLHEVLLSKPEKRLKYIFSSVIDSWSLKWTEVMEQKLWGKNEEPWASGRTSSPAIIIPAAPVHSSISLKLAYNKTLQYLTWSLWSSCVELWLLPPSIYNQQASEEPRSPSWTSASDSDLKTWWDVLLWGFSVCSCVGSYWRAGWAHTE